MLLRLIVLIIYGVGCYFLQNYFRRNPPEFSKEYVYPESRMPQALYRLAVLAGTGFRVHVAGHRTHFASPYHSFLHRSPAMLCLFTLALAC